MTYFHFVLARRPQTWLHKISYAAAVCFARNSTMAVVMGEGFSRRASICSMLDLSSAEVPSWSQRIPTAICLIERSTLSQPGGTTMRLPGPQVVL